MSHDRHGVLGQHVLYYVSCEGVSPAWLPPKHRGTPKVSPLPSLLHGSRVKRNLVHGGLSEVRGHATCQKGVVTHKLTTYMEQSAMSATPILQHIPLIARSTTHTPYFTTHTPYFTTHTPYCQQYNTYSLFYNTYRLFYNTYRLLPAV